MRAETSDFLKRCDEAQAIDPELTKPHFRAFMTALRAAQQEASTRRGEFVEIQGDEDDADVRGTIFEMDQKHGALERETAVLLSQAAKVQALLREIREGATRIRASAEDIVVKKEEATRAAAAAVELAAPVIP